MRNAASNMGPDRGECQAALLALSKELTTRPNMIAPRIRCRGPPLALSCMIALPQENRAD